MPYTKRQLNRILKVNGRNLIDPEHPLPFAARVAESLIRRRVYAYEDETVVQQFHMYRAAFNDIRSRAMDLAALNSLDTLENSGRVLAWRRSVENFARLRVNALTEQLAYHTLRRAGNAYLLGYYGRGYVMDMATKPDIHPNLPLLSNRAITGEIVQPGLTEDFDPDRLIYDALGREFRQAYADNLDDLVKRIRQALNTSIQQKLNMNLTMQAVADVMGINIKRSEGFKSNFNKVQTLTRTYVMQASNQGAEALYNANGQYLQGIQFLTANFGVCPQCAAIVREGGGIWPLGSPEIIRPPVHFNCRCTLIPVLLSGAEGDPVQAPAQTWNDWILMMGIGGAMGAELMNIYIGDDLDSTQIGDEFDIEDVG